MDRRPARSFWQAHGPARTTTTAFSDTDHSDTDHTETDHPDTDRTNDGTAAWS